MNSAQYIRSMETFLSQLPSEEAESMKSAMEFAFLAGVESAKHRASELIHEAVLRLFDSDCADPENQPVPASTESSTAQPNPGGGRAL